MASSAAKRYAQALFSLGKERNTLDAWQSDLALLASLARDASIATYLDNPSITAEQKMAVLNSALDNRVQPETRNLARILIERDRTDAIPEIRDLFDAQVRADRGIIIANITTAEPLTDAEQDVIRDRLAEMTGAKVQLAMHVDPDIIGGIIIRIGDQVIDGSVRNKLEKMRTRLVAGRA
ncbi:MAG: ATP synthase F1 subunit delta [Thermomicrobiales bacterium]|nr:ATP synthase F1 subunit delta [Thermomicrobiales bacterium]